MELKVNRSVFLKSLYFAQSIADRKSTTPSLANVLIRTEGPEMFLCAATDLRTSMVAEAHAQVIAEGGITLGAKNLYEIVKSLAAEEVHIKKLDNNWAEIRSGGARYKIVGMSDRDYPKLPDHREATFSEVDAATIGEMMRKTVFSISADDSRPHLTGIYMEADGKRATMVSTDGHRLTKVEKTFGGGPELPNGVIIPRKGVMEIRRLLESVEGTCDVGFAKGNLFIKARDVVLSVRLIESQFPPYRQVIPEDNDKVLRFDRIELLECLKRVSILSSERSWGIRVELSTGKLRIVSDNADVGEAQEDLAVAYNGPELKIGFNARYFMDVLGEIESGDVALEFHGELDPGLVRPWESHDYLGVVMPMRI